MSYIGNTPTSQAFAPGTDTFSGTGSQTAFTLSRNVATVNDILVVVNNVEQQPSNYTVSGTTLTFSPAPSSGTNNIYVRYLSTNLQIIAPSQSSVGVPQLSASGTPNSTTFLRGDNTWAVVSVTPTAVSDQTNTSTGYFDLPSGTTAQRPVSPPTGASRFNTTLGYPEYYDGANWWQFNVVKTYSIDYLLLAGAGGGGASFSGGGGGGGGGAGGMLTGSSTLSVGTTYSFTVGAGGAGAVYNGATGRSGGVGTNSTALGLTAIGGGSGSGVDLTGGAGGSGGGAGTYGGGNLAGGAATAGQGNNGGSNGGGPTAGGGGGKGSAGASGSAGAGAASSITGTSVTYAAGGARTGAGVGGANTGNGGGGNTAGSGGAGGSGVIIISVPTVSYSGVTTGSPTVTTSGSNTILRFTASGSYTA